VPDDDETMILIAGCIVCGNLFASNPNTVPSVWVNAETRCPVRPDATPIGPGEPGTQREPLRDRCATAARRSSRPRWAARCQFAANRSSPSQGRSEGVSRDHLRPRRHHRADDLLQR